MKKSNFIRMSDNIRNKCIDALCDNFLETRTSKWCSAPAFQLPERLFGDYDEIVFLSPLYVYNDKGEVVGSVYEIPLEQLCAMTDAVLNN